MTVTSTPPRISYTGDGSTTEFTYAWKILDEDDLSVYVDGDLVTAYAVSGVGSELGGLVTFDDAPANGELVILVGSLVFEQPTDLVDGGPLAASSVETSIDRVVLQTKQLEEKLGRALTVPITSELTGITMNEPEAGKVLVAESATELGWIDKADLDASLSEQNVIQGYTLAGLPAVGTGGKLVRVTDDVRGLALSFTTGWWLENKSRGIPVEHFGAKGDGSTDDSAAITLAALTTRTLIFGAGKVYKCLTGINVGSATDVALIGLPGATINAAGAAIGINVTGARFRCEGLTISGDETAASVAIKCSGADCRILNNIITTGFQTGIYVTGNRGIVRGNKVTSSAIFGAVDMYGIIMQDTTDGLIDGNDVDMPVYTSGSVFPACIYVGNTAATLKHNRVIGNRCNDGFDGIVARGPHTVIIGNSIIGAFESGIHMDGTTAGGTTTSESVVSGNVLKDCVRWGIVVLAQSFGVAITGNSLTNCGTSASFSGNGAIVVDSGGTDNIGRVAITGNFIRQGEAGISIINGSTFSLKAINIVGNVIDSPTVIGIDIVRADNVVVVANTIYNATTGVGVASTQSDAVIIGLNNFVTVTTPISILAGATNIRVLENLGVPRIRGTTAAATTLLLEDDTIIADATSAPIVVTLPSAASAINRQFTVKKVNSNTNAVTLSKVGSDTIDGATTYALTLQYQSVTIHSAGGTAWHVVGKN